MPDIVILDLEGQVCPYTNIRTVETLQKIPVSTLLKVLVDNTPSVDGIILIVKDTGSRVLSVGMRNGIYEISIQKT